MELLRRHLGGGNVGFKLAVKWSAPALLSLPHIHTPFPHRFPLKQRAYTDENLTVQSLRIAMFEDASRSKEKKQDYHDDNTQRRHRLKRILHLLLSNHQREPTQPQRPNMEESFC